MTVLELEQILMSIPDHLEILYINNHIDVTENISKVTVETSFDYLGDTTEYLVLR